MHSDSVAAMEARRLFGLTELLIRDGTLDSVMGAVLDGLTTVRGVDGAAILLPGPEGLTVVATRGRPFTHAELDGVGASSRRPVPVGMAGTSTEQVRVLALAVGERPVGMAAARGLPPTKLERDSVTAFANHAAIAIERSLLREEALRAQALERTDRMRRALVATVAHDLCGPLAALKVAASSLRVSPGPALGAERDELVDAMDFQIDYLGRLVTGLLDMGRLHAGAINADLAPHEVAKLVQEATEAVTVTWEEGRLRTDVPDLPPARADALLITQVIANLLDNAHRYGPPASPITVAARAVGDRLEISVRDHGPGIEPEQRQGVFDPFQRQGSGGRAGLGLAIAKAFVEAHHQQIWVDDTVTDGARVVFTLAPAR